MRCQRPDRQAGRTGGKHLHQTEPRKQVGHFDRSAQGGTMTTEKNRQILLASRPRGEPGPDNFKLVETAVPEAGPGQMLLHTVYLSLDPYMRGRMDAGASYAQPVEIGKVMEGSAVCAVVKSNLPPYQRSSRFLRVLGDIANKGSLVLGLQTDIL